MRNLPPSKGLYNNTVNQFEPALRMALRNVLSKIGLAGPVLPLNKTMVAVVIFIALIAMLILYILVTEPSVFFGVDQSLFVKYASNLSKRSYLIASQ
jgi:hypothetical protein